MAAKSVLKMVRRSNLPTTFPPCDLPAWSLGTRMLACHHVQCPQSPPTGQAVGPVLPLEQTHSDSRICPPATSVSLLAACNWQACSAVEDSFGPVSAAVQGISTLQATTGLPWWATLALLATGVRFALMPLTVQQLRSSAINIPLLQQATQRAALADNAKAGVDYCRSWLAEFRFLREQKGAPSLVWITAPLAQIPVFITAVMAVRSMSSVPWPGFENGGLLWFTDLSLPALSLDTIAAPMGSSGIILPTAVAALMLANVSQAFSRAARSGRRSLLGPQLPLGTLRLVLEWLTVPTFLIALQLPQAVLLYWSTSSAMALAQAWILRIAFVQEAFGLQKPHLGPATQPEVKNSASRTELPAAVVKETLAATHGIPALFNQAAEWKAAGEPAAAVKALQHILKLDPSHPRAWFALGQTFAGLKEWQQASHAYSEAAALETNSVVLARAWLGAGIAAYHDNDPDSGLQALRRAADVALSSIDQQNMQHMHVPSADPLLFTAGKLQRASVLASALSNTTASRDLCAIAVRALLSQGSILKQQGHLEQALEAVQRAAVLDPKANPLLAEF